MRTQLTALYTTLLLVISSSSYGQNQMMDTVSIELDQNGSIEFIAKNYHYLEHWGNVDSIYSVFVKDLNKMEDNFLNEGKSNTMIYDFKSKYRIIKLNSESSVAGEVSIDDQGNVLHFQKVEFLMGKDERMIVKSANLNGFQNINDLDINQLIKNVDEKVFPEGRGHKSHLIATVKTEDGKISSGQSKIKKDVSDVIELGMLFGVGTLRNVVTPDIEFQLMLGLSRKGLLRHQFGLGNQWLFSFPVNEEGQTLVKKDGFLDAIYSISYLDKNSGLTNTMGIRAGMSITTGSVNFEKSAYRAGLFKSLGKGIMLEGGFFMHKDFAEFFPYARIAWAW